MAHIIHTHEGKARISVKIPWEQTAPSEHAEFRAVVDGKTWLGYRNRSGYGWSWWTVTVDGKDINNTGDLPRHTEIYVPIAQALEGEPCKCGCTAAQLARMAA